MNPRCFVGIEIHWKRKLMGMVMNQEFLVKKVVSRFGLNKAKPCSTPFDYNQKLNALDVVKVPYRAAIGSLLYASRCTRPDISCAFSLPYRFCERPRLAHWNTIKRFMRYLKKVSIINWICKGEFHFIQCPVYLEVEHPTWWRCIVIA